jgi:asparagine synthase (glutamine-hydrolysing)
MCGIVGFLYPPGFVARSAEHLAGLLAARLVHRGPDDQGVWVDGDAGIALAHRRLAVVDLSAAGHQPMKSASERYVVAFNGEIYNHRQLRKELETSDISCVWRGHSDTETLLAAIDRWGIEPTLERTVGMFAFALWDRQQRTLTLARDRLGEKPLYYGWQGQVFLFGSELKALRGHPAFCADVDRSALALYMQYGYIPAPRSIYCKIAKLQPGTYIHISAGMAGGTLPEPKQYWSLRKAVELGGETPFEGSDTDAVDELERHLKRAISLQRVADVPLGAFLSGGIDSSTIVALMRAELSSEVKTYTVGYFESDFNEADNARAIAKHLGTDHTELRVTSREASDVIPQLPALYDEPFGDSSAIPTFLVSSLARRQVTVALSGDGGDELFGGYARYQRTIDIWRLVKRIPYPARLMAAGGIHCWQGAWNRDHAGGRADRMALYLSATTLGECYDAQVTRYPGVRGLVIGGAIGRREPYSPLPWHSESQGFEELMYTDTSRYLPDDILTKVDRASMGVSLEVRVPMLDHRVVEFAWRLPSRMKVRNGHGKWLLKQLLRRYLPDSMIDRPKTGFGVPVGQWLRGPLRQWAENLLAEDRLHTDGFLNPRIVRRCWQQHLNAGRGESDALWQILAFQAWVAETA